MVFRSHYLAAVQMCMLLEITIVLEQTLKIVHGIALLQSIIYIVVCAELSVLALNKTCSYFDIHICRWA